MDYEPIGVRESIKDILDQIEQADDDQINMIIEAIINRYASYYPDWEILFLSLHKDSALRKQDLENAFNMLNNLYR